MNTTGKDIQFVYQKTCEHNGIFCQMDVLQVLMRTSVYLQHLTLEWLHRGVVLDFIRFFGLRQKTKSTSKNEVTTKG